MTLDDFIRKWQPILTHWNGAAEDPQFAEDCWAVGFEMDGGRSISAIDPKRNWLKADELRDKLHLITDVNVIGSAIFFFLLFLYSCIRFPVVTIRMPYPYSFIRLRHIMYYSRHIPIRQGSIRKK